MKSVIKVIVIVNIVFLVSVISMWSTWHVLEGGEKFSDSIAKKIIDLASLPSKTFHYLYDENSFSNRLLSDDSSQMIPYNLSSKKNAAKILIPTSSNESTGMISLVDIRSNKVLKTWTVSNKELDYHTKNYPDFTKGINWAVHPYFTSDGSILFSNWGLFRVTKDDKLEVVNTDLIFHHTIENENDSIFWICGSKKDNLVEIKSLRDTTLVEDVIAIK